jgi:zinc transport system substrate-binding protein
MRPLQQLLTIALFLLFPLEILAAPKVMVTIKPIHSLVASVMRGVATPQLLISGLQSPHTFNLKPSQMRELEQSDIIFWIGEALETSLQKTLQTAASDHNIVELIDTKGLKQLGSRTEADWEQHLHPSETTAHLHHSSIDPHIWLSPFNAGVLVDRISRELSEFDPANALRYQANAQQTKQHIQQLDQQIKQQLTPIHELPFVVFHDAYQHFEQHYQLNAIAAVTLSPERLPGAKRISDIQKQIKQLHVSCVFNESQFRSRLINSIREGQKIRVGILDPIGATLHAGPDEWFELMQNLSNSISSCLSAREE